MNWYNELCSNGLKGNVQPEEIKPSWATHSFKRLGRTMYGVLYTVDWVWMNAQKTLYYTGDDVDSGSLIKL